MSLGGSADRLERVVGSFSPESGGMVMGTGVVSIALSLDGRDTLSKILLVICAGAWLVLGTLLGVRLWHDRSRVRQQAQPSARSRVPRTSVAAVLSHWVVPTTGGKALAILGEGGGVLKDAAVVLWIALAVWAVMFVAMLRPTEEIVRA